MQTSQTFHPDFARFFTDVIRQDIARYSQVLVLDDFSFSRNWEQTFSVILRRLTNECIGLFFRREFAHNLRTLLMVLFQAEADKPNDVLFCGFGLSVRRASA